MQTAAGSTFKETLHRPKNLTLQFREFNLHGTPLKSVVMIYKAILLLANSFLYMMPLYMYICRLREPFQSPSFVMKSFTIGSTSMKRFTIGRGLGWLSNQITSQIKGSSPSMAGHLIEEFANTLPKDVDLLRIPLTEKVI